MPGAGEALPERRLKTERFGKGKSSRGLSRQEQDLFQHPHCACHRELDVRVEFIQDAERRPRNESPSGWRTRVNRPGFTGDSVT